MASAARDLRYRQSVDGSLARELDWAVRERELRHAGEAPRRRERETERIRAIPRVELRQRQHVSLFSVFGSILVMGMAVLVLVGHIQLTVLSSDTVALKEELEELESQNVILTAQYERMFDLTTVREAAEAARHEQAQLQPNLLPGYLRRRQRGCLSKRKKTAFLTAFWPL